MLSTTTHIAIYGELSKYLNQIENSVQLDRSFADSGSSIWNYLPSSIRAIRDTGPVRRK